MSRGFRVVFVARRRAQRDYTLLSRDHVCLFVFVVG